MIRKLFSLVLMLISILPASARQPLPLNPEVRHGVLPNGLTYYILHNEFPKNRANFYIAQKVGSALETPEQYGLAHFLEHMAFNGTRHYPGDSLPRYLESNGVRLNAYTDYEETVYNIDNVLTTNANLMDSVMLVLRDWSCDLLLEDDEIDAERKVIQEEWRMRNNPMFRFSSAMAPVVFSEPQYQQSPIGTMDVVMNFPYKALRDYYQKWYRPDQQGIIIVGDFDAEEMEKKVKDMYSDIPMPENAAPREYVHVSDNERPIFFAFEDPELQYGKITLQAKFDKIPLEYRNTDIAFVDNMIQDIVSDMVNTRLYEHTQDADCKYAEAGAFYSNMYPSKTKGVFNVVAIAKDDELSAFEDALAIVARACQTGFTQSELDRAIEKLKADYERRYNERNRTETSELARGLINAFKDNEADMGIEAEREFVYSVLPQIPLEAYNEAIYNAITPKNLVILVSQQQKEGKRLPSESETLDVIADVMNRNYEAYQDETITEPLIANLPKKGNVVKTADGEFGTKELTLSNGVKVIVKPTDYKDDEILFRAFRKGGKETYSMDDAANVRLIDNAVSLSDMGTFDHKAMTRYLTGKNLSLAYNIDDNYEGFIGKSSIKDLPTLFELIYSCFTDLNPNKETYDNTISRLIPQYEAAKNTPDYVFDNHRLAAKYGNNQMMDEPSAEMIRKADYERMLEIFKEAVSNPADYTFLFTGNIDMDTFVPLLEQYVASLAPGKSKKLKTLSSIDTSEGQITDNFTLEMTTPGDWLWGFYSGTNVGNDISDQVKVSFVGDVLSIIYREILREKEGGVYSPQVYSIYDISNGKWNVVYFLQTNAEQSQRMQELADSLFTDLLKEGATPEQFNRVKAAYISQYENSIRTNEYWHDNILLYNLLGNDMITNHRSAIENLTLEDFNSFMKTLYDGSNRIQVNMHGIPQK